MSGAPTIHARVIAALETPGTTENVAARTGLRAAQVEGAISKLRRRGAVLVSGMVARRGTPGVSIWVAAPDAASKTAADDPSAVAQAADEARRRRERHAERTAAKADEANEGKRRRDALGAVDAHISQVRCRGAASPWAGLGA